MASKSLYISDTLALNAAVGTSIPVDIVEPGTLYLDDCVLRFESGAIGTFTTQTCQVAIVHNGVEVAIATCPQNVSDGRTVSAKFIPVDARQPQESGTAPGRPYIGSTGVNYRNRPRRNTFPSDTLSLVIKRQGQGGTTTGTARAHLFIEEKPTGL